jgi:hypothetical protein
MALTPAAEGIGPDRTAPVFATTRSAVAEAAYVVSLRG